MVMIGVAQEKAFAWRGWRDGGHDAHPHFVFARQAVFVNHYYFYILDPEWGPSFVKTNAYAPYPVWLYLNGHEWAKRQAATCGDRFAAVGQRLSRLRGPGRAGRDLRAALRARHLGVLRPLACARCRRRSPPMSVAATATAIRSGSSSSPTRACSTARRRAGRGLSRRSATSSTSAAPTRSRSCSTARVTSQTPGRFQTKVITKGVEPVIQAHYKHSKVKQYFKEGRALRTETTVNDPYDFGIGRTLTAENWSAPSTRRSTSTSGCFDAQLQACALRARPHDAQRVWCRHRSKTANPRPPCTSATPG